MRCWSSGMCNWDASQDFIKEIIKYAFNIEENGYYGNDKYLIISDIINKIGIYQPNFKEMGRINMAILDEIKRYDNELKIETMPKDIKECKERIEVLKDLLKRSMILHKIDNKEVYMCFYYIDKEYVKVIKMTRENYSTEVEYVITINDDFDEHEYFTPFTVEDCNIEWRRDLFDLAYLALLETVKNDTIVNRGGNVDNKISEKKAILRDNLVKFLETLSNQASMEAEAIRNSDEYTPSELTSMQGNMFFIEDAISKLQLLKELDK